MMLDSPHTSAPILMRGNALVLKTPVENAPRTSIEKYLSWSSDIPPAARFPLHRSRPAEYQPNRQSAPVCTESGAGEARRRVGQRRRRLTSSAHQRLRALVMQSSAPAPGAQSTWDSALGAIENYRIVFLPNFRTMGLVSFSNLDRFFSRCRRPTTPKGGSSRRGIIESDEQDALKNLLVPDLTNFVF